MFYIRLICVIKKSNIIGFFLFSIGWLWVRSCIFFGLLKLFFFIGWEVLIDRKGVSGIW